MQHWVRISAPGLAIGVALVAAGCGGAVAPGPSPAVGTAAAPSAVPVGTAAPPPVAATGEPEINAQEAQSIAIDAVGGGWILKTQTDDRDDVVMVWEVTVVTAGGHREVTVDMTNGTVLANQLDD